MVVGVEGRKVVGLGFRGESGTPFDCVREWVESATIVCLICAFMVCCLSA